MNEGLIIQKLGEKLRVVLGFMLQKNKDSKANVRLAFQWNGENNVRSFILQRIFFRFQFFPVIRFEFFFGEDEPKEFNGILGIGIKALKENVMMTG